METSYNMYHNYWNSSYYDYCFFKIYDSIKFGIAQQWDIKLVSLHMFPLV